MTLEMRCIRDLRGRDGEARQIRRRASERRKWGKGVERKETRGWGSNNMGDVHGRWMHLCSRVGERRLVVCAGVHVCKKKLLRQGQRVVHLRMAISSMNFTRLPCGASRGRRARRTGLGGLSGSSWGARTIWAEKGCGRSARLQIAAVAEAEAEEERRCSRSFRLLRLGPAPDLADPPCHVDLDLHDPDDPRVREHLLGGRAQGRIDAQPAERERGAGDPERQRALSMEAGREERGITFA